MNAERAVRLKREVEENERLAQRKAGERDEVLRAIKEEFGCVSLEEAEKLLARAEKELAEAEERAESLGSEWDDKWGGKL